MGSRNPRSKNPPPIASGRGSTAYPPSRSNGDGKIGYSPGAGYRDSFSQPYRAAPSGRRGDPPRRKPRKRLFWPLAILLGIAVGAAVGYFTGTPSGRSLINITQHFVAPPRPLDEVFHGNRVHVLLLGLDHVPGRPGEKPDRRSDSIILASTDFSTQQIRMVSIPRDSWVPHYLNGVVIDDHQKLGHTYAEGGVQCTKETVEHLFGVPIDYYVTINFEGFQKVIDAVGGIDIDVDEHMKYDDNWGHLHIDLQPGMQHMDGETAMGYARFRHDLTGDIGRMGRQQKVLKTLLEKMKEPGNLPRLPQLFQIFQQNVDTNMSMDQLLSLAQNMDRFNGDGMQTMTVENYGPYDGPAYVWGRYSHEGINMAQYLPPSGIDTAREFLENLDPPPPPEPPVDEQDKGWTAKDGDAPPGTNADETGDSGST